MRLLRYPSAWLPIAMSLFCVAMLVNHIVFWGVARQADEGTEAHLFQLLMPAQIPVGLFFAAKWLPKAPGPAAVVLALQGAAFTAALFPVWYLGF